MAGFGHPNASIAQPYTIAPLRPAAPSRRSLPNGPCNYRDATVGQCGCDQFWDKLSAELHDEIARPGTGSERSTWCVCGHHACFHLRASRAPERRAPSIDIPRRPLHATCDGQGQLVSGTQCDAHPAVGRADEQAIHTERILSDPSFSARFLQQTSQAFGSGRIAQSQDPPSQASTTGLLESLQCACYLVTSLQRLTMKPGMAQTSRAKRSQASVFP
ncbi:hypothetical protein P3342_000521 [Pyrenophora teres f. teres]|nr:hypothetical protein P3342_000521 [Pyrenophora teres f. teres]